MALGDGRGCRGWSVSLFLLLICHIPKDANVLQGRLDQEPLAWLWQGGQAVLGGRGQSSRAPRLCPGGRGPVPTSSPPP